MTTNELYHQYSITYAGGDISFAEWAGTEDCLADIPATPARMRDLCLAEWAAARPVDNHRGIQPTRKYCASWAVDYRRGYDETAEGRAFVQRLVETVR